jgi:hypothetical protein
MTALTLTPDLFLDLGEILAACVYETDGERYICRMCDIDVTTTPHSDDCEVKHLREWTFAVNRGTLDVPQEGDEDELILVKGFLINRNAAIRIVKETATPAPLDVERLAEAMNAAYVYGDRDNTMAVLPFMDDWDAFWLPFAAAIAAAYADDK